MNLTGATHYALKFGYRPTIKHTWQEKGLEVRGTDQFKLPSRCYNGRNGETDNDSVNEINLQQTASSWIHQG